MANENEDRIREIEELNAKLNAENGEIRDRLEKEKEELRIRLEKENAELRAKLDDSKKGLQSEIDGNHFTNTNRINDLTDKLAKLFKDASKDKDDILLRLQSEGKLLRKLIGQPLSVFFCANRSEDYLEGGEAYLTFDSKFFYFFYLFLFQ